MKIFSLALVLFFTYHAGANELSPVSELEIIKNFSDRGCLADTIRFAVEPLVSKNSKDRIYTCKNLCGARECEYSIYLQKDNKFIFSTSFSGVYKIIKHKNKPSEILVTTVLDSSKKTLRFKNGQFQ